MLLLKMNKNNLFKTQMHMLIYFLCALSYSVFIDLSALDDGLRHISFAANKDIMQSWGNVYPNSLFAEYDPWFIWHNLLSLIISITSFEKVHFVINFFSFFALMILSHEFIKRYCNFDFSSLLYIIVFILTLITSFRYVMLRPDLLSGLYVMAALLFANRFRYIFILTFLYIPFYYLFFLYTGSMGLVYLIQKKFRAFFGVFLASIIGLCFHLLYDFEGYVSTVLNILNDQNLRMGLEVKEGLPIFTFFQGMNYYILLGLFLSFAFILIWYKYEYFKSNSLALFLLITSILWINQYRYYHLFLPLIFIFIFSIIVNMDKKKFFYNLRKYFVLTKQYFNYSKNKKLFYLIAIPYSIFMLSYIISSYSYREVIDKGKYFKSEKFNHKTILSNKMDTDMFKAHYHNPTLKLIPSCSVGWFDNKNPKMKELYIRLQDNTKVILEEELRALIDYTNSDYYIHYMTNSNQKLNFDKLNSLGIKAIEINQKKILFKIRKK